MNGKKLMAVKSDYPVMNWKKELNKYLPINSKINKHKAYFISNFNIRGAVEVEVAFTAPFQKHLQKSSDSGI